MEGEKMGLDENLPIVPENGMEIDVVPMIISEEEELVDNNPVLEQPTVVSWGRNDLGCLIKKKENGQSSDGVYCYQSDVKNFVAISSNAYHTAAVTATGELYTCGQNDQGQLGNPDTSIQTIEKPHLVESLGNHRIISVSCGLNHTVVVSSSGCALSFGSNESGQLGHSTEKINHVSPKVVHFSLPSRRTSMIIVTKVACGDLFSLFLTTTSEIYGCGSASFLGNTLNSSRLIITQAERVESLVGSNIMDITAGSSHALALTASGELYGWGSNRHCELGVEQSSSPSKTIDPSSSFHQQLPVKISLLSSSITDETGTNRDIGQIIGIAAGYSHSVFWTEKGFLFGCGNNKYGQLSLPFPRVDTFSYISLPFFVVMASCGNQHTIVLCNATNEVNSGNVIRQESNLGNSLIRVNSYSSIPPSPVIIAASSLSSSSTGNLPMMIAGNEGVNNSNHENGTEKSPLPPLPTNGRSPRDSGGFSRIYGFGSNSFGQISSTNSIRMYRNFYEIVEISSIAKVNKVLYVAAGGDQSFAIGLKDNLEGESERGQRQQGMTGLSGGSSSLLEGKALLKKQFSTMVSKAVVAMNAQSFLNLIKKCYLPSSSSSPSSSYYSSLFAAGDASSINSSDTIPVIEDQRMVCLTLNTMSEIFSSPSLLAGSFKIEKKSSAEAIHGPKVAGKSSSVCYNIDIEGVEAVYVGLMQLGSHSIARLLGSIQQTVTELERALAASPGVSLPDSSIRVLLILWQSPIMANPLMASDIFLRLCKIILCFISSSPSSSSSSSSSQIPTSASSFSSSALLLIDVIASLYPSHLYASRLLKPLHEHMDYHLISENNNIHSSQIAVFCSIFQLLFQVNREKSFVSSEMFYNKSISDLSESIIVKDYIMWRQLKESQQKLSKEDHSSSSSSSSSIKKQFFISDYSYLISALAKRKILLAESQIQQQAAQNQAITHGKSLFSSLFFSFLLFSSLFFSFLLFSYSMFLILLFPLFSHHLSFPFLSLSLSLFSPSLCFCTAVGILSGAGFIFPWFVISIEREHLLQQTLLHLISASPFDLKKPLKVVFIGEEGIDEGGVRKEFFQLLTQQLFNRDYGMFLSVENDRYLWLNKENSWCQDEYQLVGSLLGLALYNGILLDIHLPSVLYKKLLQQPVLLEDLLQIDSALYNGLQQLLTYSPASEIEEVFCRTFTVEWEEFGAKKSYDLIPNGSNITVTGENRQLYVEKLVHWMLEESIREQFQSLYEGFTRVIHPSQLLLLTAEELELLMVGTPHLDFKELQANTEYIGEASWNKDHLTIVWFWEVLHSSLSFEEKQKFLLFVTGSHKAPIGGLKNIGLKIQRMGPDSESLPTSHTCFNVLLLPEYSSKEKLEDRLRKAITECEGFGLK
jgi:ubiquitin-protein ligase E3 A